jgi:hypothetical protein
MDTGQLVFTLATLGLLSICFNPGLLREIVGSLLRDLQRKASND